MMPFSKTVLSAWYSIGTPVTEPAAFHDSVSLYCEAPSFRSTIAEFRLPVPFTAPWLGAVQRRLEQSIASTEESGDPTTITHSVARAAITFFEATSDVLPGEPYLYPSEQGDVIAEFRGSNGRLTGILGPDFVILHAVVEGKIVQCELPLQSDYASTRHELKSIKTKLQVGEHGKALGSDKR
jgi:hypothetical protein